MNTMSRTILGAIGLVPAAILVVGGLTRANVPLGWIHPLLLAGGFGLCLALQLPRVARARWAKTTEGGEASIHLRFADRKASWAELALAAALATAIVGYLFLENFQPR